MRRATLVTAAACLLSLVGAASASAAIGFKTTELTFGDGHGSPAVQAGSHPFSLTTTLESNTKIVPGKLPGEEFIVPDEGFKDLEVNLPPGLVGNPNPVPRCSSADFLDVHNTENACPDSSAVGLVEVAVATTPFPVGGVEFYEPLPVYNLVPPPGVAMKIGFTFLPACR